MKHLLLFSLLLLPIGSQAQNIIVKLSPEDCGNCADKLKGLTETPAAQAWTTVVMRVSDKGKLAKAETLLATAIGPESIHYDDAEFYRYDSVRASRYYVLDGGNLFAMGSFTTTPDKEILGAAAPIRGSIDMPDISNLAVVKENVYLASFSSNLITRVAQARPGSIAGVIAIPVDSIRRWAYQRRYKEQSGQVLEEFAAEPRKPSDDGAVVALYAAGDTLLASVVLAGIGELDGRKEFEKLGLLCYIRNDRIIALREIRQTPKVIEEGGPAYSPDMFRVGLVNGRYYLSISTLDEAAADPKVLAEGTLQPDSALGIRKPIQYHLPQSQLPVRERYMTATSLFNGSLYAQMLSDSILNLQNGHWASIPHSTKNRIAKSDLRPERLDPAFTILTFRQDGDRLNVLITDRGQLKVCRFLETATGYQFTGSSLLASSLANGYYTRAAVLGENRLWFYNYERRIFQQIGLY